MADNPQVRAGTAGGTIVVAADEVTIYGGAAQIQGVKIHDGTEAGTVGAKVSAAGELHTVQLNSGTVSVSNTVPVWVNTAGTVSVTNAVPVWVNTAGTVTANSGTLLGQAGTVNVANTVAVWSNNSGTVTLGGVSTGDALEVWVNTAGTVTANSGTLLGQAGTVTALQGSTPWQTHQTNSGTVSVSNTVPVWVNTAGTVTANSGTLLGQAGTVNIANTVATWSNNSGTVAAWVNTSGTVASLPGGLTGYAEDAGHTTGDIGLQALTVRKGDAAALAGSENDYQPLVTDSAGALWTHINAGTVTVGGIATGDALEVWTNNSGTVSAWVNTAGTVSVSNTVPVWVNTAGTVSVSNLGKNEDDPHTTGDVGIQALAVRKGDAAAVSGSDGDYNPLTVNSVGALWTHVNAGTVTVGNTVAAWSSNSGTVAAWVNTSGTVASLPGGLTGYAEDSGHSSGDIGLQALTVRKGDAAALAGAENDYQPLITSAAGALWTHVNAGTVTVGNTVPVWTSNAGTVSAWVNTAGTVAVSNTVPVWSNNSGTVTAGSAVIGLGFTLGGTHITLTASGTVVPSVTSRVLYVTHEAFTVQGGTVTITARNGNGGGTLWGPMQFSPTGGVAASLPIADGGLYATASGSAVYYELAGSGTVGGRIRWAREAS